MISLAALLLAMIGAIAMVGKEGVTPKRVIRFSDTKVLMDAEAEPPDGHHLKGNQQATAQHDRKGVEESFLEDPRIVQNAGEVPVSSACARQNVETTATPYGDRRRADGDWCRPDGDRRRADPGCRRVLDVTSRNLRPPPSPYGSTGVSGVFRATGHPPDVPLTRQNISDAPDAADVIREESR